MGAGASSCGPLKDLMLQKLGEAVVFALKALKASGADQDQFNDCIKKVMDKFCKPSKSGLEPPILLEIKAKITQVIIENFPEDLQSIADKAERAVEAKAIQAARDARINAMLEAWEAGQMSGDADVGISLKPKANGGKAKAPEKYQVVISFRFGEALEEAREMKKLLDAKGVKTFMCESDTSNGAYMPDSIAGALFEAQCVILLVSKTYGTKTGNSIDTPEEMQFALKKERAFVVKVGEEGWEVPLTFIKLNDIKYDVWKKNTPIPTNIVDGLTGALDKYGVPVK